MVIALAIFSYSYHLGVVNRAAGHVKLLYNFSGLVFAFWMTLSLYLSVRLIASELFRDKVLAKFTFIRERDEREAIMTGKATKATFLTSLAILIFLFFLSCFQISFYRVAPEKAIDGKTGILSLDFSFNLFESSRQAEPDEALQKKNNIFSYTGLPVSSTTVIMVLIIWQIAYYNYSIRRLMK